MFSLVKRSVKGIQQQPSQEKFTKKMEDSLPIEVCGREQYKKQTAQIETRKVPTG